MNRYAITEKAGRFVAGQTNIGVGTVLTLTEKQAEHELRLGTLRPLDMPAAKPESAKGKQADTGKGRKTARAEAKPSHNTAGDTDELEGAGEGGSVDEGTGDA